MNGRSLKKRYVSCVAVWLCCAASAWGQPSGTEASEDPIARAWQELIAQAEAEGGLGPPAVEAPSEIRTEPEVIEIGPEGASAEPRGLDRVSRTGEGAEPDDFVYLNRSRERDYGEGQETVTCVPRHVCVILLEPKERVQLALVGDDEGWPLISDYAGPRGAEHAAVALTTIRWEARSNLFLMTDRRTYRFQLVAPKRPETSGARVAYDELTYFRYPSDTSVEVVAFPPAPPRAVDAGHAVSPTEGAADRPGPGPAEMDREAPLFVFRIEPAPEKKNRLQGRFRVYRQGDATYVVMPAGMRGRLGEWPQIVALGSDEEELVANAEFERLPDGSGRWRLPMVPAGLELYQGHGGKKRWIRAWNREIQ